MKPDFVPPLHRVINDAEFTAEVFERERERKGKRCRFAMEHKYCAAPYSFQQSNRWSNPSATAIQPSFWWTSKNCTRTKFVFLALIPTILNSCVINPTSYSECDRLKYVSRIYDDDDNSVGKCKIARICSPFSQTHWSIQSLYWMHFFIISELWMCLSHRLLLWFNCPWWCRFS